MPSKEKQSKDRRIQKTMNLLHEALGALIREKPYDEIVVQEILDRANVGRSTLYMHFRDKDELLVSGIRDMLGSVHSPVEAQPSGKPYERIVRFTLPVFQHIHQHRHTGTAMMGMRGRAIVVCWACSAAWRCKSSGQPDGGEGLVMMQGLSPRGGV